MPDWINNLISFLQENELLLSSISSVVAIVAAIVGMLGFAFGWWQQLAQKLSNRKNKLSQDRENEVLLKSDHFPSTAKSTTISDDEIIISSFPAGPLNSPAVDEVDKQISENLSNIGTSTGTTRLTRELETYLERVQSDVIEGFRTDQYVNLTVETLESEDGSTLRALQHALRSTFEITTQEWQRGGDKFPLETVINSNRLVVLLGDPGSGKTTSLRYIALKLIETLHVSGVGLIPVWISLGNWSDKNMPVVEFLWHEYLRFVGTSNISIDDFERDTEQGKYFFLLDGLNELPQRERPDVVHEDYFKHHDKQPTIDKRENDLFVLARNTRSRFIVSCRLLDYTHQPGWREFRVLPLSTSQIMEMAQRYLKSNYAHFQDILVEQPILKEVVRSPFLLRGLIQLIQEGSTIGPSDRFELVQFVCKSAAAREAIKLQLDVNDIYKALGGIAWELMDQGLIGSFFAHPEDSSLTIKVDKEKEININDVIKWGKSAGLFVPGGFDVEGTPKYRFLHQLIQEALALIYLESEFTENVNLRRAHALLRVGQAHAGWGLLTEAEDNLQRALEVCPISESTIIRARILLTLSDVYRSWRRSIDALPLSQQAVQLLDAQDPTELLAAACYGLAETYTRLRRTQEAEEFYIKAQSSYQKLGRLSDAAYVAAFGLADLYSFPAHLYRPEEAFRIYQNAIDVFSKEKDQLNIARVELQMAHLHRFQGEVDMSLRLFEKCEKSFDQLEKPWLRLYALTYGGILLRDARRNEEAIKWGQRAQILAEELGDKSEQIDILVYIRAWTASHQGKHLESLDWVKRAYQLAMQLSSTSELADLYRGGFGTTYWRAKNFAEAAKYFLMYKQAMDYEERIYISGFYKASIIWAELFGQRVSTSVSAKLITEICWWLTSLMEIVAVPTNRFGKVLFRFQWWLRRFTWIER